MSIPEQDGSAPPGAGAGPEKNPGEGGHVPNPPKPEKELKKSPGEALSPEEQMALYEKELKENDWGHQPC